MRVHKEDWDKLEKWTALYEKKFASKVTPTQVASAILHECLSKDTD